MHTTTIDSSAPRPLPVRARRRAKANKYNDDNLLGRFAPGVRRQNGSNSYLEEDDLKFSLDSTTTSIPFPNPILPSSRRFELGLVTAAALIMPPVFILPYELLAEFASYLSTPDLLALARSCKLFCHTLVDDESTPVWRAARQNCLPTPLPDPCAPNWTESAYAAFVFDDMPCDTCGSNTSTRDFYRSFTLRKRFCDRDCMTSSPGLTRLPAPLRYRPQSLSLSIPALPTDHFVNSAYGSNQIFDKAQLSAYCLGQSALNPSGSYQQQQSVDYIRWTTIRMARKEIIESEGRELTLWENKRKRAVDEVRKANKVWWRAQAKLEGVNHQDFFNSPTLQNLFRSYRKCPNWLENDWPKFRHIILAEASANTSRRLALSERKAIRPLEHLWHDLRMQRSRSRSAPRHVMFTGHAEEDDDVMSFEEFKNAPGIRVVMDEASLSNDSTSWKDAHGIIMDLVRASGFDRQRDAEINEDNHIDEMENSFTASEPIDIPVASTSDWDPGFMLESSSSSSSLSPSTASSLESESSVDTSSSGFDATPVSSVSSFQSAVSELSKIAPRSLSLSRFIDDDDDDDREVDEAVSSDDASDITPQAHGTASDPIDGRSRMHQTWTPHFRCDRCLGKRVSAMDVLSHSCPSHLRMGLGASIGAGGLPVEDAWLMSADHSMGNDHDYNHAMAPPSIPHLAKATVEVEAGEEPGTTDVFEADVDGLDGEHERDEDVLSISFARSPRVFRRVHSTVVQKGKAKDDGYHSVFGSSPTPGRRAKVAYCQSCPSTVLMENAEDLLLHSAWHAWIKDSEFTFTVGPSPPRWYSERPFGTPVGEPDEETMPPLSKDSIPRVYACARCPNTSGSGSVLPYGQHMPSLGSIMPHKERLFTLNGVKSHLIQIHGVQPLTEADVFLRTNTQSRI